MTRSWKMFANKMRDGDWYCNFGDKEWVKLFDFDEPIVPVILTEDENGQYYGWLAKDEDRPTMIWASKAQFSMCFAYGVNAEVKKGRGIPVRMCVEELNE